MAISDTSSDGRSYISRAILVRSADWACLLRLVFLVLAAGIIGLTVRSWACGNGVLSRVHQSALVAGMIAITWLLIHFHLIGGQH